MNESLRVTLHSLPAAAFLLCAQLALAGAPLKGVDVKLGKNPGGGCANRTTGSDGKADFGVWPKGNYTLTFDQPQPATEHGSGLATGRYISMPANTNLHAIILGTTDGKIEREYPSGLPTGRVAPLEFSLDGKQSLVVVVSAGD